MPTVLLNIARGAMTAIGSFAKRQGKNIISNSTRTINSRLTSFQDSALESVGVHQKSLEEEERDRQFSLTAQATKPVSLLLKIISKITGVPIEKITSDLLVGCAAIAVVLGLILISSFSTTPKSASFPTNIQQ